MTNDKMNKSDQEFDQWLKASAGQPPPAPGDEWQNILATVESAEPLAPSAAAVPAPAASEPSASSSLWSLTWPSLMAAAIPLAVALWGGGGLGLVSSYLGVPAATTGTVQQTVADPALADDQVWLSAGNHQLDVVASGDVEPLVIDPAP